MRKCPSWDGGNARENTNIGKDLRGEDEKKNHMPIISIYDSEILRNIGVSGLRRKAYILIIDEHFLDYNSNHKPIST